MKPPTAYRKQALWQMGGLIVLACALALGANHFRSDGIALLGRCSPEAREAENPAENPDECQIISLARASKLHADGEAIFLDARPQNQYARGHIPGALSLPWQDVDSRFVEIAPHLEEEKTLITYCDGESCQLSHDLALFLKDFGFENITVLINGWSAWKEAGLPVEKGGGNHG